MFRKTNRLAFYPDPGAESIVQEGSALFRFSSLRIDAGDSGLCDEELVVLDKPHDQLEQVGLSLAEAKELLGRVQERVVGAQASAFLADHRRCGACGKRLWSKGRTSFRFRTPFGDVPVTAPRLKRCRCETSASESFSPLVRLFSEHVAPEMLYLETKWASLVPFGVTVELLKDVLPVGTTLNAETVRNHLHRVATRMEGELGEERAFFIEGSPQDRAQLPLPEGPVVVGIDGGYVRAREPGRAGRQENFEVVVGQSIAEARDNRYFGLVQSFDEKPKRRLHEVLREQGLQMNQEITFLTDGGDTVRSLAADMSPCAEHVLDWFHITMRLTVLGQYAKGLAHHDEHEAQDAERELKRIKGYLWNGTERPWSALTVSSTTWSVSPPPTPASKHSARASMNSTPTSGAMCTPSLTTPSAIATGAGLDGLRRVHRQHGRRKALLETPADALVKAWRAPDASDPNPGSR